MSIQSKQEQYNSQLIYLLTQVLQNNLTGKLVVNSLQEKFYLYFKHGCFIYGMGGSDRIRRWYRSTAKYRNILEQIQLNELTPNKTWEYQILQQGYARNQLNRSQIKAIITASAREILFTLISGSNYNSRWQSNILIDNSASAALDFKAAILAPVKQLLLQQQQLNLPLFLRPHFTPIRSASDNPKYIPVEISPLLDGKHSFWDIALHLKISVVAAYQRIFPAYKLGLVKLKPLQDLDKPIFLDTAPAKISNNSHKNTVKRSIKPLIACIDDSTLICQQLEKIITAAGYQSLKINQPVKQMLTLIERKPALILLDLVMPNIDGYNLCKLLRKTPVFKRTPIIILSSSNNSLDRDRILRIGATDFLTKPPRASMVLETIKKYLPDRARITA